MKLEQLKSQFGFDDNELSQFLEQNKDVPKGTFQIRQRGNKHYWYYTLSVNSTNRVKYLTQAYDSSNSKQKTSFTLALEKLADKFSGLRRQADWFSEDELRARARVSNCSYNVTFDEDGGVTIKR